VLGRQVEEAAATEGGGDHEVSVSPAAAMPRSAQGAVPEGIPGGADLQARPAGPDAGGEPGQIHPPLDRMRIGREGGDRTEKEERFVTGEAPARRGSASFHSSKGRRGAGEASSLSLGGQR